MAWITTLLTSLARWACLELSHQRGVISLLLGLGSARCVLGDVDAVLGHDGESRQPLGARGAWRSGLITGALCTRRPGRDWGLNLGRERPERLGGGREGSWLALSDYPDLGGDLVDT